MASQDEVIARLNRDKKSMDEGTKQLNEKLQAEEDKVNHLNKLKQKLESTLDEVIFRFIRYHLVKDCPNVSNIAFL